MKWTVFLKAIWIYGWWLPYMNRIKIVIISGKICFCVKRWKKMWVEICIIDTVGLASSYLHWDVQTNRYRSHPVRDLKLFSEPCFCFLNTIFVCKLGINNEQRHIITPCKFPDLRHCAIPYNYCFQIIETSSLRSFRPLTGWGLHRFCWKFKCEKLKARPIQPSSFLIGQYGI